MKSFVLATFIVSSIELTTCFGVLGQTPPFGALYPIDIKGVVIVNDGSGRERTVQLGLKPQDVPAELRFRIADARPGGQWSIDLTTESDSLHIDSDNIKDLEKTDNSLVIFAKTADVRVVFSPNSPNIIYDALIHVTAGLRPEYLISDRPSLLYADKDLQSDQQRQKNARAIVRLDFTEAVGGLEKAAQCTGFQIKPGLFLTAMHCADPAYRAGGPAGPDQKQNNRLFTTIRIGVSDTRPNGVGPIIAKTSKLGRYFPAIDQGGLDYAVLTAVSPVPSEFINAIIDLSKSVPVDQTGQDLDIYQIWSGDDGAAAGKAVAMNPACKTGTVASPGHPPSLILPACPAPDFMHGCDSEGGSSGSPLFLRGTDKIAGLLWGGISRFSGNCAVSIQAIIQDAGL